MGVLDDLKKQAAEQKAREESEQQRREQRLAFYREQIKPRLESIYSYLHEFTEQLNYVTPDIPVTYELPEKRMLPELSQKNYVVKVDSSENISSVTLRFSCEAEGTLFIQEDEKGKFEKLKDFLYQHKLNYHTRQHKDEQQAVVGGDVTIEKKVPVLFQFDADIDNSCILLWIRNFEKLGTRKIILLPSQVHEQFLDDLGRYILRRSDTFMKLELAEEQRDKIREKIERDKAQKEQEMLIEEQRRLEEEQRAEEQKLVSRLKKQVKKIYGKATKDNP